jgi:hypothetical protein
MGGCEEIPAFWTLSLEHAEWRLPRLGVGGPCVGFFVLHAAPFDGSVAPGLSAGTREEHQRRGDAADALFRGAGLPARIESAFAQNLHRTCFGDSVGVTIRHALGTQGRSDSDDRPSARSENY